MNDHLEKEYAHFLTLEYDQLSASKKYDKFTEIVTNAIITHTPIKKNVNNKIHRNPVSWWDEECDKVKRLRKCTFLKWMHTKNLNDYIDYKKHCAIANKTFKVKRRNNYKLFAQNIDIRKNSTYAYNTCKILKNKWVKIKPSHTPETTKKKQK